MANLYSIKEEYQILLDSIDPDSADEGAMKALGIAETDFKDKSLAYVYRIRQEEAKISEINLRIREAKEEIERLESLKKRPEGIINRLKSALILAVQQFGKIEGKNKNPSLDLTTARLIVGQSEKLEVKPANSIPPWYFTTKEPEKVLDKKKLKAFLEQGNEIPGTAIIKSTNLVIK